MQSAGASLALSRGGRGPRRTALDSLVADYLRASGYDYALSVFVPESGVAENACVARDVLEAWHIGEQSALFRAMTAKDGASGDDGGRPGTAPAAMGGAVGGAVGPGANAENRPPRAYLEEMMGAMVEASNATS